MNSPQKSLFQLLAGLNISSSHATGASNLDWNVHVTPAWNVQETEFDLAVFVGPNRSGIGSPAGVSVFLKSQESDFSAAATFDELGCLAFGGLRPEKYSFFARDSVFTQELRRQTGYRPEAEAAVLALAAATSETQSQGIPIKVCGRGDLEAQLMDLPLVGQAVLLRVLNAELRSALVKASIGTNLIEVRLANGRGVALLQSRVGTEGAVFMGNIEVQK